MAAVDVRADAQYCIRSFEGIEFSFKTFVRFSEFRHRSSRHTFFNAGHQLAVKFALEQVFECRQCFSRQTSGCQGCDAFLFLHFLLNGFQRFVPRDGFKFAVLLHHRRGEPDTGFIRRVVAPMLAHHAMVDGSIPITFDAHDAIVPHHDLDRATNRAAHAEGFDFL